MQNKSVYVRDKAGGGNGSNKEIIRKCKYQKIKIALQNQK